MSKGKSKHPATKLLLKAHLLLLGLALAYGAIVLMVLTPWVQTHVVYAHRIDWFGYNGFDHPENYGLAPGKTVNLHLKAADNTTLGAWFIFSEAFYRTLPFPPSSPPSPHELESQNAARIRLALTHSPTLLFLHGNTGTRALPLRTALYTALTSRLHTNILALDYRGFGDSSGYPSVSGVALDALAAWEYLVGMGAEEGRVVVVGHSLGTAVVGLLGARLGREGVGVGGMVLLSGFSSIGYLMGQYYLFGVVPLLKPLAALPFVPRVLTWSIAHNFDTLTLVPDIKCSVLVAHAEDDWDISHTHSSVIFNALLDPYLPPSPSPSLLPLPNSSSPWHTLTTHQAARAVQRAALVTRTEVEHFGVLDEFRDGEGRRIALLKTRRGGHDIGRMEGVQDVIGRMFGLID
ncbi:Alpha/Beta hydrolase protein [Lyophyllum atratum]|nr:Alpha/Beta hydrolase protein [Lyophyllum atratum]